MVHDELSHPYPSGVLLRLICRRRHAHHDQYCRNILGNSRDTGSNAVRVVCCRIAGHSHAAGRSNMYANVFVTGLHTPPRLPRPSHPLLSGLLCHQSHPAATSESRQKSVLGTLRGHGMLCDKSLLVGL